MPRRVWSRKRCGLVATIAAAATAALLAPSVPAAPIVSAGVTSLPQYQGSPAEAHPIRHVPRPEQNPFMAPNPNSNIHNDTWMTDVYRRGGPLGEAPVTSSNAKKSALCGSLTFDSDGQIATVCPSIPFPPEARVIDPDTLETLATYELPDAPDPPGTKEYQNFAGGGYLFLDRRDRIWVGTKTGHVYVLAQRQEGTVLKRVRDYDLTGRLDEANERISSALPDFDGRIWFVTRRGGKVGTIDRRTGKLHVIRLGEQIQNSFAISSDGVYIVSDTRLYRFKATRKGRPRVIWKKRYRDSGIVKPGQADAGSGTTPTILDGGYVAITDNAEPMNVVVYRTDRRLHGRRRKVCEQPVFGKQKGATENSLIGARRSLIVENNYGYQDPFGPSSGALTEAGFARVDVRANGRGCSKVWTNKEVRAPTVVPKMSLRTGLIYTYERKPDPTGNQGYFWTALDFRSGETEWSQYAGSGLPYNNNYAGLALGPDGTAYLGVIGGIIALRDG